MIAHTLGNPFDLDAVTAFAEKHDLWLIEDCCDAVGATYEGRHVGTFGDLATVELLPGPPHHDGRGRLRADRPAVLKTLVESFRDWGRDCWCDPGHGQHLRQALRLAARRAAARLRPQVHLLAHRLQPQAHRHAGGRRRRAARQAARLHRGPPPELRDPARGPRRPRGVLPPARGDAGLRPELVRLPARGPRRRPARPQRRDRPARGGEDRHAAPVRRQPHAPAGLPRRRAARRARSRTPTSS